MVEFILMQSPGAQETTCCFQSRIQPVIPNTEALYHLQVLKLPTVTSKCRIAPGDHLTGRRHRGEGAASGPHLRDVQQPRLDGAAVA